MRMPCASTMRVISAVSVLQVILEMDITAQVRMFVKNEKKLFFLFLCYNDMSWDSICISDFQTFRVNKA